MSELHKSDKLRTIALENGWIADVIPNLEEFEKTGSYHDLIFDLYCVRDAETIKATWKGDRFQHSTYAYGAYRAHPARSGGILKILEGKPDVQKLAGATKKIAGSAHSSQVTYEELTKVRNVPWEDHEEVTAFNVLVSVVDKTITWVRRTDGEKISQMCPAASNLRKPYFRVKTTSAGKRVLEWCSPMGFHACYLEDIIDVA